MSKEKKSWDFLECLTKKEIIHFLKHENFFHAPTKKKVNYIKWMIVSDKLQKEMDDHLNDETGSTLAKEIDSLAVKINAEKNPDKRWNLFEKRGNLLIEYGTIHDRWKKLNAKMEKNDKLYDKCKKEGKA